MSIFKFLCFGLIFVLAGFSGVAAQDVLEKDKQNHRKSPSRLDMPNKGLYFGFIINNSAHFIEVAIWSNKSKKRVSRNIVLPPPKPYVLKNKKALTFWDKKISINRSPNVISLWLKLDTYKISIRNRDDIVDEGLTGTWKTFITILDKEYIEKSPGPFTFVIENG